MASRVAINNMRNLPVKTALATEGNVTRADAVSPDGGVIEGVVSRASPIAKGDLVQLSGSTVKGVIVVQKYSSGNIHGVAVSSPQGIDANTVSGSPAAAADMRRVDVAFFGLGIVEMPAASGNNTPGHFYKGGAVTTGAPAANGGLVVVSYAVSGEKVPVLVGFSGVPSV